MEAFFRDLLQLLLILCFSASLVTIAKLLSPLQGMVKDPLAAQHKAAEEQGDIQTDSDTSGRPSPVLVLSIAHFTESDFRSTNPTYKAHPQRAGHRIACLPTRNLHVIEVLPKDANMKRIHRQGAQVIRRFESSSDEGLPVASPSCEPERIRLRGAFIIGLLEHITNSRLEHHGAQGTPIHEQASLVFLHPFKYLIRFEEQIKAFAKELERALEEKKVTQQDSVLDAQADESSAIRPKLDETLQTTQGSATSNCDVDQGLTSEQIDQFQSAQALQYINLVIELFNEDLKGILEIRRSLKSGEAEKILFEHLWLLYTVGELAFQTNKRNDSNPTFVRITRFYGARPILNNTKSNIQDPQLKDLLLAPNSKGQENSFFLSYYGLDFDGDDYGPRSGTFRIPHWAGQRAIRELAIYPYQFGLRKGDSKEEKTTWLQEYIDRGKKFRTFGDNKGISHWYYQGQEVGSRKEVLNSKVVLDPKMLQTPMVESTADFVRSGRALGGQVVEQTLNVYKGEEREVVEGTDVHEGNGTVTECRLPGCDNNEVLHDDIQFSHDISQIYIETVGASGTKCQNLENYSEEDFAIFMPDIVGFVLTERRWARLRIEYLKVVDRQSNVWDSLQLPKEHKTAILATIQGVLRKRLQFDSIKGKGQGVVLFLHGDPGLGKTFTAEAIAAHTKKPLYSITCGDLGTTATKVEMSLKEIFQHGHRWGCVLLLDEADVFLGQRDRANHEHNAIVGVFLRQLEYYSGILILTTNRPKNFDSALLSRVHLALRYPSLSETSTINLFQQHFRKISMDNEVRQQKRCSSMTEWEREDLTGDIHVEEIAISSWVSAQFRKHKKWWNGREIRNAFQTAISLAEFEADGEKGDPQLKLRNFQTVARLYHDFYDYLDQINNGGLEEDEDKIHDAA